MNRLQLAFRLAWRDILQHKWRSTLAVTLFALPITILVGFTSIGYSSTETMTFSPATEATIIREQCAFDDNNVQNEQNSYCVSDEKILAKTDMERISAAIGNEDLAKTFRPEFRFAARAQKGDDPALVLHLHAIQPFARTQYRDKTNAGEIALGLDEAKMLNANVGDKITLTLAGKSTTLTLVSTQAFFSTINIDDVPFSYPNPEDIKSAEMPLNIDISWVSDQTVGKSTLTEGVYLFSEEETRNDSIFYLLFGESFNSETFYIFAFVVILMLLLISCIAGPIFAVSARRKLTTLGLLSATGAKPADLRNIMLAEGVIIGILGALFGNICAAALGSLLVALQDQGQPFIWAWDVAIPITLMAIIAGLTSALIPALRAGASNPVEALADGTSIRMRSWKRRYTIAPIVTLCAGIGVVTGFILPSEVWILIASISVIAGTGGLVFAAAKLAPYFPLSIRLALRDAVRNFHRTVPAVAAITATVLFPILTILLSANPGADDSTTPLNSVTFRPIAQPFTREPVAETIQQFQDRYHTELETNTYLAIDPETYQYETLTTTPQSSTPQSYTKPVSINPDPFYFLIDGYESFDNANVVIIADENAPELLAMLYPGTYEEDDIAEAVAALKAGKAVVNTSRALENGKLNVTVTTPSRLGAAKTNEQAEASATEFSAD